MKSNRLKALTVIIISSMIMSACSIDQDKLNEGLGDIRDAIADEDSDATDATKATTSKEEEVVVPTENDVDISIPDETVTPEPSVEPTAIPTPTNTPTPTATPMPTPTEIPNPERVDLSDLEKIELNEFEINIETFEESYVVAKDVVLANFTGNRMLVSVESNPGIQNAINSIIDGFYQETAGIYLDVVSDNNALIEIEGEDTVIDPYDVTVSYAYSDNGRVLSVIMRNQVTQNGETISSSCEYVSFDMLTGQYITVATIAKNYNDLNNALAEALANYTEDEEDLASDFTDIVIVAQAPGAETIIAEVYGTKDGNTVHTTINVADYKDYLNRYGKVVYGLK